MLWALEGAVLGLCASGSVSLVRGEASCRESRVAGDLSLLLSEILLEGKESKNDFESYSKPRTSQRVKS